MSLRVSGVLVFDPMLLVRLVHVFVVTAPMLSWRWPCRTIFVRFQRYLRVPFLSSSIGLMRRVNVSFGGQRLRSI